LQIKRKLALSGAGLTLALAPTVALTATSSSAATPPKPTPTVRVRVEGPNKTLLGTTAVKVPASGYITKGGTPSGQCPANSAAGAFNKATNGRWTGKYYKGIGIFVTSILGVRPSNVNNYWTFFVANRSAQYGICSRQLKLYNGEQLLFAITNGTQQPLVLRAPAQAHRGSSFTATAGTLATSGFTPASGIHVVGSGVNKVTNAKGQVTIPVSHTGTLYLRALGGTKYVRSAVVRVRELP
jgi:hypothetical protein